MSFYIATSAYEYIDYNYGFGILLILYAVGTLAKSSAKENWFITLQGLTCEQLPTVCIMMIMIFNPHYLQCTLVVVTQIQHHTLRLRTIQAGRKQFTNSFLKDFL